MFLRERHSNHLVEVLDMKQMYDPYQVKILGRLNIGEDLPEAEEFKKSDLEFPSGESLPRCWIDPHYRDPSQHPH